MATLTSILKNAVITLLFLTPAIGLSQNPFFEQMAKLPDVNYTYLSSATLSMADDVASLPSDVSEVVSQLKSIEMLETDDESSYKQIRSGIESQYNGMSLLTKIMDDEESTMIYGAKKGTGASQYSKILYIKDDGDSQEIKMILFTGDIEPDTIKKLVD